MRFFLALLLLLPLNNFAQSSLDYFNSLPEEIQNQITEGESNFETLQIEDTLSDEAEELVKEPFYGYNFFNKF